MIIVGIFTYIISCIAAYFISSVWHIFILGALIGSAQGGIQALSRSYFAKIYPKEKSNEFFGFYNIFGKFSAIIGPAIMSLATTLTGNARLSLLGIIPLVYNRLYHFYDPAERYKPDGISIWERINQGILCLCHTMLFLRITGLLQAGSPIYPSL
jgi:UMF1 family MFS transporter